MNLSRPLLAGLLAVPFALLTACGGGGGEAMTTAGMSTKAWTLDPISGTGFVGKGDVQLVYGWNNKQLQDNAGDVQFQSASNVVTEVSWICTNTNNERTQERQRTTTTSTQGYLESVARERNQITGFLLIGYDGEPVGGTAVTDGPAVNSCPSGPWTLTSPAGEPVTVSSSVLQVSIDGTTWYDLPEPTTTTTTTQ